MLLGLEADATDGVVAAVAWTDLDGPGDALLQAVAVAVARRRTGGA
jgi:hypothetical protein